MSHSVAGGIVQWAGFRTGFLFLTGLALIALLSLWKALPETLKQSDLEAPAGGADIPPGQLDALLRSRAGTRDPPGISRDPSGIIR